MRNPNAPWEIRNAAARRHWVALGRRRYGTAPMRGIAHDLVAHRSLSAALCADAVVFGEAWWRVRWSTPEEP